MILFNRVGEVVLGRPGEVGARYRGLNFKFDLKKTLTPEMNPGVLTIYNLAPNTRRSIHELETVCIIRCGYTESQGPVELFRGYVSASSTTMEGPNLATTLEVRDGYQELRSAKFTKSYAAGSSLHTIVRDVIRSLGLPESVSTRLTDVANKKLRAGVSFQGLSRDALDDVAHLAGVEWSIQSGRVKLLAEGSTDDGVATVLSSNTGMVGRPIRLTDVVTTKGTKGAAGTNEKQLGWRVESLLLPDVEPGNRISIRSDEVDGFFKVVSVHHHGELMGSDWGTTVEVVDL